MKLLYHNLLIKLITDAIVSWLCDFWAVFSTNEKRRRDILRLGEEKIRNEEKAKMYRLEHLRLYVTPITNVI